MTTKIDIFLKSGASTTVEVQQDIETTMTIVDKILSDIREYTKFVRIGTVRIVPSELAAVHVRE